MLDLETMSTTSNAAIVSIGAVFFEPSTGELGADIYLVIDLENSSKFGDADGSTIKWWLKQSDEARDVFNDKHAISLERALAAFNDWISTEVGPNEVNMWGNGASFDNVILRNAYRACNQSSPWKFYNDRDVRTMVDLGRSLRGIDPKKTLSLQGTAHNALDDAMFQARYVSEIYMALSFPTDTPVAQCGGVTNG